ncbi:MAG TPA: hypothetical protein PK054_08740 [Anaerohalosphaeraceae bacterium]|nr:hypothetical protein [Anaerohalosphaeraceae bacterium]HOL89114.1 hypothetical protein [Anaerohalosphaeraceae bacterium]HPP56654.1 hypothetical protein [Anaerohalosphaeraceae bacterium]
MQPAEVIVQQLRRRPIQLGFLHLAFQQLRLVLFPQVIQFPQGG